MPQAAQLEKLCIGVQLGGYEATRFKNQAPKPLLQSLAVLQSSAGADSAAGEEAINRGLSLAKGNLLARCGRLIPLFDCFRGSEEPLHLTECMRQP